MASSIVGPVPKESDKRVRRHKDTFTPHTVITPDRKKRGPRLPKNIIWSDRTKVWWETWRSSPQAQLMEDTDWDAMLEAALIHNEIWSNPGLHKPVEITSMTKELHGILGNYGMSYCDRLKLRIKIDNDSPSSRQAATDDNVANEVPDNVVNMYKRKLTA